MQLYYGSGISIPLYTIRAALRCVLTNVLRWMFPWIGESEDRCDQAYCSKGM